MADRSYEDPCGIARALDRVGERWALLIVRQLLFGPKRFGELQRGLATISPNVLSQRLRELERAGVVGRAVAGPPVSGPIYALTDRGQQLEAVLSALAEWGSSEPLPADTAMSVDAFMFSLRTTFDPAAAAGQRIVVDLRIDADRFTVAVDGGALTVSRGAPTSPDVTLTADRGTIRAVFYAGDDPARASKEGRLRIDGPVAVVRRLVRCFRRPATRPRER